MATKHLPHRVPIAPFHNEGLITQMARERARFWKYPAEGPWTVSIRTPKGEFEITCVHNDLVIRRV